MLARSRSVSDDDLSTLPVADSQTACRSTMAPRPPGLLQDDLVGAKVCRPIYVYMHTATVLMPVAQLVGKCPPELDTSYYALVITDTQTYVRCRRAAAVGR